MVILDKTKIKLVPYSSIQKEATMNCLTKILAEAIK